MLGQDESILSKTRVLKTRFPEYSPILKPQHTLKAPPDQGLVTDPDFLSFSLRNFVIRVYR